MTHPKLQPAKPVDRVAFEPVMIAVSKAHALTWTLEALANGELTEMPVSAPASTREWLCDVVGEALRATLDEIEREYRKLGTDLLAKEAAALAKSKDGA